MSLAVAILLHIFNVLSWMLLFIYGMHYYTICVLFLRKRNKKGVMPKPVRLTKKNRPMVTIQLPIFNEVYVVERLIQNIACIKWPRDLLEIQVLDDSTDETTQIARKEINKLRKEGLNIKLVRRKDREGHKAGALKYGMTKTKSNIFAIFDSDFLPEPDFLERTIPYLMADEKYAFVQTRWEHINRDFSKLTYAQSIGIDGHFVVEQSARSMNKLWMNFNGTAGVWRREAIEEAGNWMGDTLTEDLDLSYRAQLKGWTCLFLPDVSCPAEIPDQIMPYKVQQFRWAKGSIQTAIKLLPTILRSKTRKKNKIEAMIHLTYYSVQFLMLLNLMSLFPLMLAKSVQLETVTTPLFLLFSSTLLSPITLMLVAQRHLKNNMWKFLKALPYMFFLGFGISVYIAIAFFEAIFGKKSSFIRTPKYNLTDKSKKSKVFIKKKYRVKFNYVLYLEILVALFCFAEAFYIYKFGNMLFFYFPVMMGVSLSYVVYRSIKDSIVNKKYQKQAEQSA